MPDDDNTFSDADRRLPQLGGGSLDDQILAARFNIERSDERLRRHFSELRVEAGRQGKVVAWSAAGALAAAWLFLPKGTLKKGAARLQHRFGGKGPRALWVTLLSLLLPLLHVKQTTKQATGDGRAPGLWKLALDLMLPLFFKPR